MTPLRVATLALAVISLCLSSGCGGSGSSGGGDGNKSDPKGSAVTADDFKKIALAYESLFEVPAGKPPSKPEDLAKGLNNDDRLLGLLKSGEVVFIYNVKPFEMPEGSTRTVLAYEKDVPEKGGLVLLGSGFVKKMTAEEFKKAPLAKPKDK